jgi:hypothetical protein
LSDIINAFLLVFAAMFPIVDPLGSAPIFLSLTADRTPEERTRLARDVAFNSFFMMLGSLLFGSEIIEFFGIEIAVVRVAGRLIIAWMGWELLNEGIKPPERQALNKQEKPAPTGLDRGGAHARFAAPSGQHACSYGDVGSRCDRESSGHRGDCLFVVPVRSANRSLPGSGRT